jgi:hypothetical protein
MKAKTVSIQAENWKHKCDFNGMNKSKFSTKVVRFFFLLITFVKITSSFNLMSFVVILHSIHFFTFFQRSRHDRVPLMSRFSVSNLTEVGSFFQTQSHSHKEKS